MGLPNTDPVYSKFGVVGPPVVLTTQANDYTALSIYNKQVFKADVTNGGFVQRLRFKARGTNVATVARIYIGESGTYNTNFATPATPTGTPSSSGGTMLTGANYFATIVAIGPGGQESAPSTYSSAVSVTGPTGSIAWAWTATPGASSYRIYVTNSGGPTGTATFFFTSGTNSFTQTAMPETGTYDDSLNGASAFYGEISLPATTASASAATPDIDYPINFALPPGYTVIVGLGTTVAAGWSVMSIGGSY